MSEEEVLEEILSLMNKLNITYMPTVKDMRTFNKKLEHEIYRLGGSLYFSKKYNLKIKKPTTKWNESLIIDGIMMVINTLEIEYFPTKKEIDFVTQGYSLSNKIYKTGGSRYWADKLGLNLKQGSDTSFGVHGEDLLKEKMTDLGYTIERLSTNCLYDFLVEDCVRVDCKISNLYHGNQGSFYSYNLERRNPDCDIFIFITCDDEANKRFIVVPQNALKGKTQISIGEFKSKWYDYIDRYDFIDKYIEFYNSFA